MANEQSISSESPWFKAREIILDEGNKTFVQRERPN